MDGADAEATRTTKELAMHGVTNSKYNLARLKQYVTLNGYDANGNSLLHPMELFARGSYLGTCVLQSASGSCLERRGRRVAVGACRADACRAEAEKMMGREGRTR